MNRTKKDETILEAHKLMEIFKAGFIDGYSSARKRRVLWRTIYKKCGKAWDKRFIKKLCTKVSKGKQP